MARTPLTARRLLGLDRSGPPPSATVRGQPLNPWTLPNVIGYVRLAMIPVFLLLAFRSGDGSSWAAGWTFGAIAASDYLDGILARVTGQYSRLGALLDPLVDRLLVVSGVTVAWSFELLPKWALALLVAREVLMLVLSRLALRRGRDIKINMVGRWAVWPTTLSLGLALVTTGAFTHAMLLVGLALTWSATALYVLEAVRAEHAAPSSSP